MVMETADRVRAKNKKGSRAEEFPGKQPSLTDMGRIFLSAIMSFATHAGVGSLPPSDSTANEIEGLVSGSEKNVTSGPNKWSGGVEYFGRIYGVPIMAKNILKYRPPSSCVGFLCPHTGVGYAAPIDQSLDELPGWSGGAVVGGDIYFLPSTSPYMLKYNPRQDTLTSSDTRNVPGLWNSGLPSPWNGGGTIGGVIYGIPYDSDFVLVFNPRANTFASSQKIPDCMKNKAGQKWWGGAVVGNTLYAIPYGSDRILMISPGNNTNRGGSPPNSNDTTIVNIQFSGTVPGSWQLNKWRGAVALGSFVYGVPFFANHLLVYNAETNTTSTSEAISSNLRAIAGWSGGAAYNGKIYCIPFSATHVLIYNPNTNRVFGSTEIPASVGSGSSKWNGAVLYNNKIYGIPNFAGRVLIVDTLLSENDYCDPVQDLCCADDGFQCDAEIKECRRITTTSPTTTTTTQTTAQTTAQTTTQTTTIAVQPAETRQLVISLSIVGSCFILACFGACACVLQRRARMHALGHYSHRSGAFNGSEGGGLHNDDNVDDDGDDDDLLDDLHNPDVAKKIMGSGGTNSNNNSNIATYGGKSDHIYDDDDDGGGTLGGDFNNTSNDGNAILL